MTTAMPDAGAAGAARRTPAKKETMYDDAAFYLAMIAVSAGLIFAGFAPSFYLKSVINAPPPLTSLTITHGVVYTSWMIAVLAQSSFIAMKKPAPHRQLGILGALLFGAVVAVGISTALTAARLGHAPPGAPPQPGFSALPIIGIFTVFGFVAAALLLRKRPDWHKRLMLAGFIMMTQPGTGRLAIPLGIQEFGIGFSFIVMMLLLAGAIFYDWRKYGRVHPAYWTAAIVFVVFRGAVYWGFESPAWAAFVNSLIGT